MPHNFPKVKMRIEDICRAYNVGLCYVSGSQSGIGKALLEGRKIGVKYPESDLDFAVAFLDPPEDNLRVYGALSLDIQELVSPHRADLLFLHKKEVITDGLSKRLIQMADYRNRLVHFYHEVTDRELHDIIKENLGMGKGIKVEPR